MLKSGLPSGSSSVGRALASQASGREFESRLPLSRPLLTMLPISHLVQPIILGAVLAFLTANILMNAAVKAVTTTVNGWSIVLKIGRPGNGVLLQAGCAKILPGTNLAPEAAYWTTVVDGAGRRLNGQHGYVLNFL